MHTDINLTGPLAEQGFKAFKASNKGPHKSTRTWFVLADGGQAVIYRNRGRELERIGHALPDIQYEKIETPSSFGQRTAGGGAPVAGRHGYESSNDSMRHEDQLFIRSLADYLNIAMNNDAFDSLVIAAAPRTLGDLRTLLSTQVRQVVAAELNKDLVNLPMDEVRQALGKVANI